MLDHPFLRLLVNLNHGIPYTMGMIVRDQAKQLASDPGAACYPNKGVRHQSMKMYTRMCSWEDAFADRVLAAMRFAFGGHVERPTGG
jgi:hypothetical protein